MVEGEFALDFSLGHFEEVEVKGVGKVPFFQVEVIEQGGLYFEVESEFVGSLFDFEQIIRV